MNAEFVKDVLQQYTEILEMQYSSLKGELHLEFSKGVYERMTQVAKMISQVAAAIREINRMEDKL